MPKTDRRLIIFVVLVVAAVTLSCLSGNDSPLQDDGAKTEVDMCDVIQYLVVNYKILNQETNQFGTQLCDYQLEIISTYPDAPVFVFFYQYDADGYQDTEQYRWMGNIRLEPAQKSTWDGYVYIYDDPDATGPLLSIPMSIAGIVDEPQCTEKKRDMDYLDSISIPLDLVCPME